MKGKKLANSRRRVPSNHPRSNCGSRFGSRPLLSCLTAHFYPFISLSPQFSCLVSTRQPALQRELSLETQIENGLMIQTVRDAGYHRNAFFSLFACSWSRRAKLSTETIARDKNWRRMKGGDRECASLSQSLAIFVKHSIFFYQDQLRACS